MFSYQWDGLHFRAHTRGVASVGDRSGRFRELTEALGLECYQLLWPLDIPFEVLMRLPKKNAPMTAAVWPVQSSSRT